ncbi:MAG TPA: metallopeptidase TldD-related protein [Candidatus Binataceae bacterium]|nr:metallopeptidase TldD-related protein [Candidatus Binataceae bacterium]
MRSIQELRAFTREAAAILAREKDFAAFEVYSSASEHRVARLNYTSDIPSRGIEEFKSLNADGFAIRFAMRDDAHATGYAAAAGDFSSAAMRDAIARARRSVVVDPNFPGLPSEPRRLGNGSAAADDLMNARDGALAEAAWDIIGGAIRTFNRRSPLKLAHPGLVIGGDLSLIRDRVAIANTAFDDVRIDESAHFRSSVTALIEALEAKGTATAMGSSSDEMKRAAARLGRDAIARALELRHGERPDGGVYRVVLGPQPIAEIINYMVMGSLTTGAFHAASSVYQGRFGAQVMDPRLSLADDPGARNAPMRRRITCEGLPAERTELIHDGRLVGLLSTHYETHRLLADERRGDKLGSSAPADPLFPPQSAYRLGEGPGRRFDGHPSATGTNVVMRASEGVDEKLLCAAVGDGVYVGRIWYTYPINGQRAGDFTCTISGDSYVIRKGALAAPLAPNCLRINAHIDEVFARPIAVGGKSEAAAVWGAPEIYFVPAIAAENITLASIGAAESD